MKTFWGKSGIAGKKAEAAKRKTCLFLSAIRLEAIGNRLEVIAIRLEAMYSSNSKEHIVFCTFLCCVGVKVALDIEGTTTAGTQRLFPHGLNLGRTHTRV